MSGPALPETSWVLVKTHRVRRPRVLWTNPDAGPHLDPEQVYCRPAAGEPAESYAQGTRFEWADRYGGTGIGAAGGSGRCATYSGLQCKGVGATPLVAADADAFHSSGTLGHIEAATEILFSEVYRSCLPFGAVPVLALVATGTRCAPRHVHEASSPHPLRSLLYRPFVPRPAHFMRNTRYVEALRPRAEDLEGWTYDAMRTRAAMAGLAAQLRAELNLAQSAHDEPACLDAGLRELARRLAWQAAASFAKRMPHGSFSPSNVALSGAYLDYGLTSFIAGYQRHSWLAWSDPWEELKAPLPMLAMLRQQLDKYHPISGIGSVIGAQELVSVYQNALNERLRIEFARMAGLTEDLTASCPAPLLDSWLAVILEIARRGAGDREVPFSGRMAGGGKTPAGGPRRYQLSAALAGLWAAATPHEQDTMLAPALPDATLRIRLIRGAADVRTVLTAEDPAAAHAVAAYLARQASRKNQPLDILHREAFARHCVLELQDDAENSAGKLQSLLNHHIGHARCVLGDLDRDLPGMTGREQIAALAAQPDPKEQHPRR